MHKKKVIIDVAAIHKHGLKVFEPAEDIETVMYYKDRPLTDIVQDACGIISEQALDDGQIQGAAIDATVVEPPGSDHPLVSHDKILVTPHIAANSDEAMSRTAAMAAQEIVRVLSGENPFNIVNPQIYQ